MAADRGELKCLLLPLGSTALIVPNSAVAEVITQQEIAAREDAPDWFLGSGGWRGTDIPLIAFDLLCGDRREVPAAAGRFVVLFGLRGEPGFYGIRIESLPRTESVDAERLRSVDGAARASEFIGARAIVGERECAVPNLDALERAISAHARAPD